MNKKMWNIVIGNSPVVATAIHDGHELRQEVDELMALSDADRLREEDPHTGIWTEIAETRIVANYSRFQVDLNRPREKAVYVSPEDAWGLNVWTEKPGQVLIDKSLQEYDQFYSRMHDLLQNLVERHEKIVVLDLHTYNHRREGANNPPSKCDENPEINIGTGSMDRELWGTIADRFIHDLACYDILGRTLDVRENIKFRGGQFSRWAHGAFPGSVCVMAVEVKKFFMDEWTGVLDQDTFETLHRAINSTVPGIMEELTRIGRLV